MIHINKQRRQKAKQTHLALSRLSHQHAKRAARAWRRQTAAMWHGATQTQHGHSNRLGSCLPARVQTQTHTMLLCSETPKLCKTLGKRAKFLGLCATQEPPEGKEKPNSTSWAPWVLLPQKISAGHERPGWRLTSSASTTYLPQGQ